MYQLYVMRHAKSSWDDLNINDFDRPLSKRGKKNAKMICEFFVKKKFKFDYALISSSKRTKKTFQILSKKINKPKKVNFSKDLYLVDENAIIKKIKEISSEYKSILIINHEPSVKNLVRNLTKNHNTNNFKLMNYKFPTAAFAKIEFDIKSWNEVEKKGVLKEFIRPKDLQDSKE